MSRLYDNRKFNSLNDNLKLLYLTINSFLDTSRGALWIWVRMLIEYLQLSYLLFSPKFNLWNFMGFDESRKLIYTLSKFAVILPAIIESSYVGLYSVMLLTLILLTAIALMFGFYFANKRKNLEYSCIICEKTLSFFFQMIPVLTIPLLLLMFSSIYCVSYLNLDDILDSSLTAQSSLTGNNSDLNTSVKCFSSSHLLVLIPGAALSTISLCFGLIYCYFYFCFSNIENSNKETLISPTVQKQSMFHKLSVFLIVELGTKYLDDKGIAAAFMLSAVSLNILVMNVKYDYFIHSTTRKVHLFYYLYYVFLTLINQFRVISRLLEMGDYDVYFEILVVMSALTSFAMIGFRLKEASFLNFNLIANENKALQALLQLHRTIFQNFDNKSKSQLFAYLIYHNKRCKEEACPLLSYKSKILSKVKKDYCQEFVLENPLKPVTHLTKEKLGEKALAEEAEILKKDASQANESIFSNYSNSIYENENLVKRQGEVNKVEVDHDYSENSIQYLVYHQEQMLSHAILKFPFSFELKFYSILYLIYVYENYEKAIQKLEELISDPKLSISQRYMVFVTYIKTEDLLDEQILQLGLGMNTSKNINEIKNVLFFQRLASDFRSDMEKISWNFLKFWDNFASNSASLSAIISFGLNLISSIQFLFISWNKLEKYNCTDPQILLTFGMFLCDVLDEKSLGKTYINKSKCMMLSYKENNIIAFDISSALTKGSNTCIAVSREKEGSYMTRISLSFAKLFGYNFSELEGKDVNILIPSIFHTKHNQIMYNFSQSTRQDSRKFIRGYAIHKHGYLMHIHINITKVPSFKYDNSFLIRAIQSPYLNYVGYLLVDQKLNICYVSSEIPRIFEMNEKETMLIKSSHKLDHKDKFNLTEFVKELYISFDDFNIHEKDIKVTVKKSQLTLFKEEISSPKSIPTKAIREHEIEKAMNNIIKEKLEIFKANGKFIKCDCNLMISNFNRKTNTYGAIRSEYIKFRCDQISNSKSKGKGFYKKLITNIRISKLMNHRSSNRLLSLKQISTDSKVNEDKKTSTSINLAVEPKSTKAFIEFKPMFFGASKTAYFIIELTLGQNLKKFNYINSTLRMKDDIVFKFDLPSASVKLTMKVPIDQVNFLSNFESGKFHDLGELPKKSMSQKNVYSLITPTEIDHNLKAKQIITSVRKEKKVVKSADSFIDTPHNLKQDFTANFGSYLNNVIFFKVDFANDFKLVRQVYEDKITKIIALNATQETVMIKEDFDDFDDADSDESLNQKIEIRKFDIFSNSIKIKNSELKFLKTLTISILVFHLVFTLSNYILIMINSSRKNSLINLAFNIARLSNYSMSIADCLLNTIALNNQSFNARQLKKLQLISTEFANYDISQFTSYYLSELRVSAINLYNIGNIIDYQLNEIGNSSMSFETLYWPITHKMINQSNQIINTTFAEAVSQIFSASVLIGLKPDQIYTLSESNIFLVLYNTMNSLILTSRKIENMILNSMTYLDISFISYFLLGISCTSVAIFLVLSFIFLLKIVTQINKITIELLCINSIEAQTIINSSRIFMRLVKSQLDDEDIEYIEEEPVTSDSSMKVTNRVKSEISKNKVYSAVLYFLLYFAILFIHHFEIVKSQDSLSLGLDSSNLESRAISNYIRNSLLPSLYIKIAFLNESDSFSTIPVNYTANLNLLLDSMINSYNDVNRIISQLNNTYLSNDLIKQYSYHFNTSEASIISDTNYYVYDSIFLQANLKSNIASFLASSSIIKVMTDTGDVLIPLFSLLYENSKSKADTSYSSGSAFSNVWIFLSSGIIILLFILMWFPSEKYILNEVITLYLL